MRNNTTQLQSLAGTFLKVSSVASRVGLSLSQIYRLEKSGQFPTRIDFGQARGAWALADIVAWMQERLDARPGRSATRAVAADDRFVGKVELRALVLFSDHYVLQLEKAKNFPIRIPVGGRVLWLESEVRDWRDSWLARNGRPTEPIGPGSVIARSPKASPYDGQFN